MTASIAWVLMFAAPITAAESTSDLWTDFLQARERGATPVLPDFSYAGYQYCEQPIPDLAGPIFNVTDYGAQPDDEAGDEDGIQAAIDAAEAAGGGVVFFPTGQFDLSLDEATRNQAITINHSGIVLRGSGSGAGGTEIKQHLTIPAGSTGENWKIQFRPATPPQQTRQLARITADVSRESLRVSVSDAAAFAVGDRILLRLPTNKNPAVKARYLEPYPVDPDWDRPIWFLAYHEVADIDGDHLLLREPVRMDIRVADGWRVDAFPDEHLREVGIEDLSLRGNWHITPFRHGKHSDEESSYDLVHFAWVVDGWVRRCTFHDSYHNLKAEHCARLSVLQCHWHGVQGHKAIALETCWGVLMGLGTSAAPHYHIPSYDDSTMGFVLWRFDYSGSSYDPHGEWNISNLVDACRGWFIDGRMGTAQGDLPNHLRHLVFWNVEHTGPADHFDWWKGHGDWQSVVKPIIVGLHGNPIDFDPGELQVLESHGTPVAPASLFEAQLAVRLGAVPEWLAALAADPGPNAKADPTADR